MPYIFYSVTSSRDGQNFLQRQTNICAYVPNGSHFFSVALLQRRHLLPLQYPLLARKHGESE